MFKGHLGTVAEYIILDVYRSRMNIGRRRTERTDQTISKPFHRLEDVGGLPILTLSWLIWSLRRAM